MSKSIELLKPGTAAHLVPATMEKRFEHDCAECVYLGTVLAGGRMADLYFHANPPTVIARRSSDGWDYISGMICSYGREAELTLARLLAEQAGLLSQQDAAGMMTWGELWQLAKAAEKPLQVSIRLD